MAAVLDQNLSCSVCHTVSELSKFIPEQRSKGEAAICMDCNRQGPNSQSPAATKADADEKNLVGQAVLAIYEGDGKRYKSIVRRAVDIGKVQIEYIGYNDFAVVEVKNLIFGHGAAAEQKGNGSQHARHSGGGGGVISFEARPQRDVPGFEGQCSRHAAALR